MSKFRVFFNIISTHVFLRALHSLEAGRLRAKTLKFIFVILVLTLNSYPQAEPNIVEDIFQSSKNLHQWGTISSFNGLPSERINAITQTSDGFLWFATDNGLAKFDGRRVQTNLSVGLSSVKVLSMQTDTDGTLWIGTEKGAFFYQSGFFQPIQETKDYEINSIFIEDEVIYLTSPSVKIDQSGETIQNGKIFRATKGNNSVDTEIISESPFSFRSILRIEKELYVGTLNSGLVKIKNGQAEQVITRPVLSIINILAKDPDAGTWIGTKNKNENNGLFHIEKFPNLKLIGENLGAINSIGFGKNETIWAGTEERGAYLFKGEQFRNRFTFENTSGGLRSNKILATYVDREGVIWFGTDKGVSRYDPESPRNERLSDDAESNYVRTLFLTKDGKSYAGTNRGLYEFNDRSNTWNAVRGFSKRTIYAMSANSSGYLLIGSPSSLLAKDGSNIELIIDNESIRAINRFQDETYFASFGQGLKKLDADNSKVASESNIISLHNENDKLLWIGTINKGVFIYDGKNTSAKPELEQLKETAIRAISGNEIDGIWFATDKGLYLFKDGQLQIVLANQNVRDVFTQRNSESKKLQIWCATENGLYNLIFNENFGWISSRIDIEQGLSSQNIFAILPINESSILIGTNRGVVRYNTTTTNPLLVPNRIVSQRLHQPSELKTGINLDYPQNSISVEVLAISSRTFPEQFQYSFLLYDSNNKLIDSKFSEDSQFLMDKLEPDKYRVEVRAYDKNLLASESLSFNITVGQAPFPLIASVLGVLLLIALATLFWAIWSQQKIFQTSEKLVYANKELNNARLNLANEAERERHRISRDLHDQTLADLRHLILMADDVPSEKSNEFRIEIESVSNEIRRICEDLSPSVLENIGFAAALEWAVGNSVEQVSKEHKIEHEFYCSENLEEDLKLNRAEQIQIYRIAQEVLNNIVRHSEATKIIMRAETSIENGFFLKITDNGKIFSPEESKKGRGLANINARAKLIKAKFGWEKAVEDTGMIFTLTKN